MGRALLAFVTALFVAAPTPAPTLVAQTSAPGQVTPARPPTPGAEPVKGTAVLRGAVVAMDTGAPLRRVAVRAFGTTPAAGGTRVTTTDDQGRYELRELAAGRYIISASKGGFVSLQYGQRRPSERGTPVEVAGGETVDQLTIALPRGGVITGRVSDDVGEPIAGTQVQVLRYGFMSGGRRLMPAGMTDQTDDTGAFRIFGLPPGDYYISARMSMGQMRMPEGRLAMGDNDQGFAPTYYPGTPSTTDAEPITVGVGQEVSGISFGLTPTRLASISGRVVGWTRTSGIGFVNALPEDGLTLGQMLPGQVQPEGDFEMRGVPPGRYILRVQPRGGNNVDQLVGTISVVVAGSDLTNVTIAMQRPGRIRGRVEFEGGVPSTMRASQLRVYLQPLNPGPLASFGLPPEIADDFSFHATAGSGPAFLQVGGVPGWYLKAVVADGQDTTDSPLTVPPGTELAGVRLLLTQARTTLAGSVRNDRGDIVVDAVVVVFPDDEARWTFGSRLIRTTRPDTAGRYELTALPPSNGYRIVAVPVLEEGQAYDPDFLSSVRDRAERLSLNEGETKAVDLRLR